MCREEELRDPQWKRLEQPEPLKILDPETSPFREIPEPVVMPLGSKIWPDIPRAKEF
jgi:hypothetical protein